jgi:hypothetical protein
MITHEHAPMLKANEKNLYAAFRFEPQQLDQA